jgi:DHA1 family tetracycline resistance protein-like MFS transporter
VGLLGSAASYLVFSYADSVSVLLLSRVLAGVGGANIPVAQAYIADITPARERAGNMGLIGAAFGLGFIFGPAVGGVLAPIAPELPGLAAAGLCGTNALLAVFLLPESLPAVERRVATPPLQPVPSGILGFLGGRSSASRWTQLRVVLEERDFMRALILSFIFTTAFSIMHPIFPLFAVGRFGLSERDVGWLFAFIGVISAVMQGGVVRVLVSRVGEVRLIQACSLPFTVGFVLIGRSDSVPALLGGLGLLAVGFGGTLPSLVSLLSRSAPEEFQGGSLGLGQSAGAFARIVGPFLAGVIWDSMGTSAPYFVAAGIGAVAGAWGLALHQPE